MDKNPLEITSTGVHSTTNKRGRPVNSCSIQFSNPPRRSALIAQILKEKSLKKAAEKERQQSSEAPGYSAQSTSVQCWERTANLDSDYEEEIKEIKPVEIKVEVLCETHSESPNVPREEKPKIPREKKLKIPRDKSKKRNPTEKFACDYPNCSYAAKLACNLIKHKRIHTSEKPYICDQCPFRSNFINSLKVHTRLHTEEKPYNCEICGYRCNTSSNLKKHRMHRHPEVAKI